MKKTAWMLFFLCGYAVAFGQHPNCNLVLTCRIIASDTGQPIATAQVQINRHKQLNTNALGESTFYDICKGKQEIIVTKEGYNSRTVVISMQLDTLVTIFLHPLHAHIDVVDVVGHSHARNALASQTLTTERRSESQGKSLGEVLTDVAGMSILRSGNITKPVLNGLYGSRLLLINNDVRHESQQWGNDHAPEIDPFAAQDITVIKNSDAVRYGHDALAGVVLINPSPIRTDKPIQGSISSIWESNGRSAVLHSELEGRSGCLAYRMGVTGKKGGNLKTADYYLGNTGVEELNFNGIAQYQAEESAFELSFSRFGTTLGVFEGSHIGSKEDILVRIAHGRPFEEYSFSYDIQAPKQQVTHDLAKLRWHRLSSNNSSLEATYSYQRNQRREYDLRRMASDNLPMSDMVLTTQSFEFVAQSRGTTAGINGSLQVNNNTPGTGTTPIIPNFENHTIGIFVSHKHFWGPHVWEAGLRYDYKYFDVAGYRYDYAKPNADGTVNQYLHEDQRHFNNLSGVAGISYAITKDFFLKSHIGLAWRAPSANELYSDGIHHGTGTYEVGDPDLKSEKGLKWVNNLHFDNGWMIANADLFLQSIDNYSFAQPNPDSLRQTIRGTFPLFQYQQTDAMLYGADVSVTVLPTESTEYAINFSTVIGRDLDNRSYLSQLPADRLQHSLLYRFSGNTYLRLTHQFTVKQQRYEIGSDYVVPPSPYHLWGLLGSQDIHWGEKQKLNVQVAVENLFNVAYKDYMDRFRYYAHLPGRNITFKLNYNF